MLVRPILLGLIALGGNMSRLIQFILIAVSLMILAPAQASLNFDTGLNTCQVFAADDSDGGKKKDSDKKDVETDIE